MPAPRRKDEPREEFIQRCMSEVSEEYPDNAQRYAVCVSYADKKTEMKEDIFVLVPKKAENRGQYLKRCSNHPKMKEQFGGIKERMGYCLTSFNEYYKYWTKIADNFAEVPANTNLGACITKKKAQGIDYKNAYAQCASKVVVPSGTIVLNEDNLLIEPVEFGEDDNLNVEPFATIGPRGGIKESKKAPNSGTPNPEPKGEGSAKGDASGKRGAKVSAEQEKALQQKVDEFNERDSNTKNGRATLGALKSVFQRGLGAYNTSHSPNIRSSEQWAYARVNAFLYLLKNGRPENPKYTTDYDLLPEDHPKKG